MDNLPFFLEPFPYRVNKMLNMKLLAQGHTVDLARSIAKVDKFQYAAKENTPPVLFQSVMITPKILPKSFWVFICLGWTFWVDFWLETNFLNKQNSDDGIIFKPFVLKLWIYM